MRLARVDGPVVRMVVMVVMGVAVFGNDARSRTS